MKKGKSPPEFDEKKIKYQARKIIQANVMLLVQYAVGSLIPLLLVPHIVKVIGLDEYGHIAVLMAWGNYGAIVVQYAFQMTGPKQLAHLTAGETPARVFFDIAFAKLLLLSIVIPVIAVSALVSTSIDLTSSFAWIVLFAMPVAAALNSVWFLQAQGHFLPVCIIAIAGSLSTLFIGFSFIKIGNHSAIDFAVLVSFFGAIFIGIGSLLLAVTSAKGEKYEWRISRGINALKDGWHLFISQFISMFYSTSGPIVINFLLNAKAAGAYSVTERMINALMAALLLTHTAAYPRLATAYTNNRVGYWRMLKFILMGYLTVAVISALIAWSLRELVAQFLYGTLNGENNLLLFWGLIWLVLGVFGSALTGYLTVSGRSREVWPLTLKILLLCVAIGVPSVVFFGCAGWLMALVFSQLLVLKTGFKYWISEYGR